MNKPVADTWVEAQIVGLIEQGEGVDIVASARDLEVARVARDRARDERKAFVELADALDAADFRAGYEARKTREADAERLYEDLLARAAEATEIPHSADAWNALDLDHKRRVVRLVVSYVVVAPPASRSKFEPITDRFDIVWNDGALT